MQMKFFNGFQNFTRNSERQEESASKMEVGDGLEPTDTMVK